MISQALQHDGQNAMLQRGFILAGLEAALRLIEAELPLPGAVGLPQGMMSSCLKGELQIASTSSLYMGHWKCHIFKVWMCLDMIYRWQQSGVVLNSKCPSSFNFLNPIEVTTDPA